MLDLTGNNFGVAGAKGLSTLDSPGLRMLQLSLNDRLDDDAVEALAAGAWPQLSGLFIASTRVSSAGVMALAESPLLWPALLELDVSENEIYGEYVEALFEAIEAHWPHLQLYYA